MSESSKKLLELIKKNVHILLRLINQILDFRKVENGRMKMQFSTINLLDEIKNWNDAFRMALLKKHLKFSIEAEPDTDFQLTADEEKMECIYFNLLSNAIKYTPENGEIAIRLTADNNQYTLTVFNSGSHIPETDTEIIFERFYQINGHQAGTGIGLALVRAFVEMHGGNISAHSDHKGTYFIVNLPQNTLPNRNATPMEHSSEEENREVSAELIDAELDNLSEEPIEADTATVLVIDDNADIRTYIKSFLSKDYRVLLADNGINGLKMAMKYVPDVIISDVMMPEMDGNECCKRLKSEMQTSHIPVILLTACALDEQRIEGYDGGADSYISKPFNSQLLTSRVRNLISNRKLLRKFFSEGQTLEKVSANALDKDFVSKFKKLVEEHMKDSELNVEELGRDMGMSRVQLYRKLKSLTNYSPNELLRQMRLKKAASLLASSELSVAEIAYEVGFSSPSYFTKCYKEQFGESPTDFLKRTRKC
ncbi:two component system sensor histidine kinase/response regulator hybrid [gut metagenome]|uniref:histidine kinase n=1 Tax=gut metagenome TaxID=749906 RepID=J9FSX6_9ZZZZ